jgi:hypothetical protein
MDSSTRRHATTMLTVDAGPGHRAPARFYVLMVRGGESASVREELLVPYGAALRRTHRRETLTDRRDTSGPQPPLAEAA